MKQYLKQILSAVSLFFCATIVASAELFQENNTQFLQVVLLDKYPCDDDFKSAMIYGALNDNFCNNSLTYKGETYFFDTNEKINPESKIENNGAIFFEIQNNTNSSKRWRDVILYDISISEDETYSIIRNFRHEGKLYRIKAVNKDVWDRYSNKIVTIVENFDLIRAYFYNNYNNVNNNIKRA